MHDHIQDVLYLHPELPRREGGEQGSGVDRGQRGQEKPVRAHSACSLVLWL